MQNTLKALAALTLLAASSLAAAADLGDDMDTTAENYKTVLNTDSAATLTQSLQNMRAAAGTPNRALRRSWRAKPPTARR